MALSQLAFLDRKMHWDVEPGEMDVLIGSSSLDIRLKGTSSIGGEIREVGAERAFYAASSDEVLEGYVLPVAAVSAFSLDTEVGDLLADEAARQVLERHLPCVGTGRMVEMIKRMTVRQLGGMRWVAMQPAQLEAIGAELAAIAEERSPR